MDFDLDRICELAGLNKEKKQNLTEGMMQSLGNPRKPIAPAKTSAVRPMPQKSAPAPAAPMRKMEEDDGVSMEETLQDDETYYVDEIELMESLANMRETRLMESKVRDVIRNELDEILEQMEAKGQTASWVYGNNKPTNSKKGQIARGFKGIGFK